MNVPFEAHFLFYFIFNFLLFCVSICWAEKTLCKAVGLINQGVEKSLSIKGWMANFSLGLYIKVTISRCVVGVETLGRGQG